MSAGYGEAGGSAANFAVEPLSVVAASWKDVLDLEKLVLLADRPGCDVPYALPLTIPRPSHALRERGLALLWARAVTVSSAIVGTSSLRLVCELDETYDHLTKCFRENPKVTTHLEQYGAFSLKRASPGDVPKDVKSLPFSARKTGSKSASGESGPDQEQRFYVGVDYGRSDVKCAVLDGKGKHLSTYVTRWWRPVAGSEEREFLDPAKLKDISEPLRCLGEAALEVVACALKALPEDKGKGVTIFGLGLSAAGCVQDGHLCGLPPAFGGCDAKAAAPVTSRLEHAVLEYVGAQLTGRFGSDGVRIADGCAAYLVNDGDASAMWGAKGLEEGLKTDGDSLPCGLFLSCGTGLAGGIVMKGGDCCQGVFEMGKLVMGLRSKDDGVAPLHDTLGMEGVAQGMAGTQRSFFNLLAARGGELITEKAEQRAAIVAMQKRPLDDDVRNIFNTLGDWLAQFVIELLEYLPFQLAHVEAGGKLTDAASGEVMLAHAREKLSSRGVQRVQRAEESEFGQAIAMAEGALPR